MNERPDLDQGHGVRFEKVITRHIRRIAEASNLTYSEMTRVLVDEAILARLTRTDLDRYVLREAVLHALEHQPKDDRLHDEYTRYLDLSDRYIEGAKYTYTPIVDFGDPALRALREEEEDSGWTTITPGS